MWLVATYGEEGCSLVFLQPEVRRRSPRRMCVCDAFFATALAGEQRACMYTAAGWFLGRREARGDRFGKDNFGCIGLACRPCSAVARRAAPRRFMRWSSPEAPILQFELSRCTLDAGRADFSRDRRMQSGFFRRISPSSRDCSFRREECSRKRAASREAPASACPAPAAKACYLALL